MSALYIPRKFIQQPNYAGLGIDPAWEKKVVFASVTGIPGARDFVSKQMPAINGSTVGIRPTQKGRASYTGNVAHGLVWANLTPVPSIFTTGITLILYANPAAQATQQRAFFLGNEDPVPSNQYNQVNIAFNCDKAGTNSSGLFSAFEYDFGFKGTAQSSAGQVDGKWHVFVATRPPGFGTFTLYRDGINVTSGADSANAITMLPGVRIHCHPTGSSGYMGEAILAVALNEFSNADQVARISNNPWQIIRAPARALYLVSGGGGGSSQTLNSVEAIATSAATTPTLTPGSVTLSPAAAISTSVTGTPTLTPGQATLSPAVAIATSAADAPTLSASATLSPAAVVAASTTTTPTLTPGTATTTPAAAVATSVVEVPTLTNGSQLQPSAAVATSVAATPTLTPGSVTITPAAAVATSQAEQPSLTPGLVSLTPDAAVSTSVAGIPTVTSGTFLNPAAAIATTVVTVPTLTPGSTTLAPTAAEATSGVATPTLTPGSLTLAPAASVATSVMVTPIITSGGAPVNLDRLYTVAAEERVYVVSAESRAI